MTPSSVKAVGIVSEITKNASIPPNRGRRSDVRSGGTALVSHAKAPYIHQIAVSKRTTWASASPVGWWTSTEVSCVIVKTKTRSKKSSRLETRSSSSLAVFVPMGAASLLSSSAGIGGSLVARPAGEFGPIPPLLSKGDVRDALRKRKREAAGSEAGGGDHPARALRRGRDHRGLPGARARASPEAKWRALPPRRPRGQDWVGSGGGLGWRRRVLRDLRTRLDRPGERQLFRPSAVRKADQARRRAGRGPRGVRRGAARRRPSAVGGAPRGRPAGADRHGPERIAPWSPRALLRPRHRAVGSFPRCPRRQALPPGIRRGPPRAHP